MKLEHNKEYRLKYTAEFCNYMDSIGIKTNPFHVSQSKTLDKTIRGTFIGEISLGDKPLTQNRNIFLVNTDEKLSYLMFGADNIDYIVDEDDKTEEAILIIEEMQKQLKHLYKIINKK